MGGKAHSKVHSMEREEMLLVDTKSVGFFFPSYSSFAIFRIELMYNLSLNKFLVN